MFPPSIKLERKKKLQEYKENEDMIKQQKIQAGIYQAPKSAKALNFDIIIISIINYNLNKAYQD